MTKFINNLCLYLLHAVFSLVKPAISNTYLILMGFFQVFLQLHSSFKSKQQASHSSITPKFLGSMYFSAKGDAPSPMQIPFLQIQCLLASCLLCAYCCCCLHCTYSTYQLACIIWQAGRLGDKIESQEYKCKMPWTESTTTTTDTKVQFEKNRSIFILSILVIVQEMFSFNFI